MDVLRDADVVPSPVSSIRNFLQRQESESSKRLAATVTRGPALEHWLDVVSAAPSLKALRSQGGPFAGPGTLLSGHASLPAGNVVLPPVPPALPVVRSALLPADPGSLPPVAQARVTEIVEVGAPLPSYNASLRWGAVRRSVLG